MAALKLITSSNISSKSDRRYRPEIAAGDTTLVYGLAWQFEMAAMKLIIQCIGCCYLSTGRCPVINHSARLLGF
eukprot:8397309-Karenia_brevis.AAC.1